MAKRNEVNEKDYIVRRMFEKTNKSILDLMLEHFEPDWSSVCAVDDDVGTPHTNSPLYTKLEEKKTSTNC